MEEKYLTVTALTRYLKYKFDSDANLRKVYIKGEISNFKAHSTGHLYFSIKDENSIIKAIMFASNAKKLKFTPEEGMKVLALGSVSVYEGTGNYQLYVEDLTSDGVGNLYIEFEKLKAKLAKEGLFDNKYKKEIPAYPNKIGIVTAPTGAAIRDILSTIKRRYPLAETYLFPALVQGEGAHTSITKQIEVANKYDLDTLIVGRGGGSFEDLNCFNSEDVARAIFASHIPVISAVGHEVDFTIADFVADLRAPTPTGAAEMAVPNIADLKHRLKQYNIRISESISKKIKLSRIYLDSVKNSFVIKNPRLMFENKIQDLDLKLDKLNRIYINYLENKKLKLENYKNNYILKNPKILYENKIVKLNNMIEKIKLLNPLNTLDRGYSITFKNDKAISSIADIKENDSISIKLKDGLIESVVKKVGTYGKEEI